MQPFTLGGDRALEAHARALEAASGDYRVLRRLLRPEELWLTPSQHGTQTVLGIVGTETTGLNDDARLIELSIVKLVIDAEGWPCEVHCPLTMCEDPGEALSTLIRQITGLADAALSGLRFDEPLLRHHLHGVDALVAWNAAFDARHWRARFPWSDQPWICALKDHDWLAEGHAGRSLASVLSDRGLFYPPHRAEIDAWALTVLLTMQARDGRSIAANLVDAGRRADLRIEASGAPFAAREGLKAMGCRWDARRRLWSIEVRQDAADGVIDAMQAIHPSIRPTLAPVDWFNRHV